jgi:hypothetical protein
MTYAWRSSENSRSYERVGNTKRADELREAIKRLGARTRRLGVERAVESPPAGSGAQCLAVDPADPNTVYAGLREGTVQRTSDGGRSWVECALPQPEVFSLAVKRRRRCGLRGH